MKKQLLIIASVFLLSCTENQRARTFGGVERIQLKPNEVLLLITWKNDDMWVLTKDTTNGVEYFRENSSFGLWEGEVIVNPVGVVSTTKDTVVTVVPDSISLVNAIECQKAMQSFSVK